MKIWPDVGSALAAGLADETMFYVGQAKVIGPLIGIDGDAVATVIVRAIDQQTTHAHLAHFAEGDFLGPLHHRDDQSTSAARFMAGLFGFLTLTQCQQGPPR
jgi:hypothetical protein